MNSNEKFNAVIRREKPDRLPFYYPTVMCSVASKILGREVDSGGDSLHFKEELTLLQGDSAHQEFVHKYEENSIELANVLKADVIRQTWRSSERPTKQLDEWTLLFEKPDGSRKVKRFFPDQQSYGVLEDTTRPKDPDVLASRLKKEMRTTVPVSEQQLEAFYNDQVRLKNMATSCFPFICGAASLFIPMHDPVWLEAALLEEELLSEYFLYRAEALVSHLNWLAGQGVQWINGGGDLASQTGPVYAPETFRKILLKPYQRVISECKLLGMIYCFRSDGSFWPILDLLVKEAGLEAIGETDRAATMTVGDLHRKYPELIVLGNINSATLSEKTESEVREETRMGLGEADGYGYIPGPSNAIMHGTPVENVYAMIDEITNFKPSE